MRKIKLLAVLAIILTIMVVLKCCSGKEKEPSEVLTDDTEAIETVAPSGGEEVSLGVVEENENGGVNITVTKEDGTQKTYVFEDVAPDSWYVDAVNYVVSTELMNGSEDGPIFQPEYGIQRLQFAIVLYRFADGEEISRKCSFSDVTGKEWFSKYVDWVVEAGYMGGLDDGTFSPFGYLTVEQAIMVLYRCAGEPAPKGTLEDYPYAPKVSAEGKDAVTWAWNNGLINEKECVWYPTQTISRAQVAILFMRYRAMMQ